MNESLKKIYEIHHKKERGDGFTILEKERGFLFKKNVGRGKNVLDIGCRDGALTKYFIEGNKVLGIDIDELALKRAKDNFNIETMPVDLNGGWEELGGKVFDVVVAGEILEHLYYPERVIEKVSNRLNNGGTFVGSVPNAFNIKNRFRLFLGRKKNTPLEDPTHINHFEIKELVFLLKKFFKEVRVIGIGRGGLLARSFPGFFAFDFVFVCTK